MKNRCFPKVCFEKTMEIVDFLWFPIGNQYELRISLQNDPQNLISAPAAPKNAKKCASIDMGKRSKNHFFTLWNKVPLKEISPRIATGLPLNQNSGRSQLVSSLKSQVSTLNLSTLFSSSPIWESTAEVSRGRGVPRPNSKSRKLGFFRFLYAPVAPINFSVSVSKSDKKCTDGVVW